MIAAIVGRKLTSVSVGRSGPKRGRCTLVMSKDRGTGCKWALGLEDQFLEEATGGLMRSEMSSTRTWPSPARLALLRAFSAAAIRSFGTAPVPSFHAVERLWSRQPPPICNFIRPWPPGEPCTICKSSTASIARCATVLAPRASVSGKSTANCPPA